MISQRRCSAYIHFDLELIFSSMKWVQYNQRMEYTKTNLISICVANVLTKFKERNYS